mmetsp:Transcript_45585/g.146908  ORF Transcript_45585/g.146908 Transcript_45585/m.146908 type:complete len:449 (-) Transcript_45585:232-1578(-)
MRALTRAVQRALVRRGGRAHLREAALQEQPPDVADERRLSSGLGGAEDGDAAGVLSARLDRHERRRLALARRAAQRVAPRDAAAAAVARSRAHGAGVVRRARLPAQRAGRPGRARRRVEAARTARRDAARSRARAVRRVAGGAGRVRRVHEPVAGGRDDARQHAAARARAVGGGHRPLRKGAQPVGAPLGVRKGVAGVAAGAADGVRVEVGGLGAAARPLPPVRHALAGGAQDAADVRGHPRRQARRGGGALQRGHPDRARPVVLAAARLALVAHAPAADVSAVPGAAGVSADAARAQHRAAQQPGAGPKLDPRDVARAAAQRLGGAACVERPRFVAQPHVFAHQQCARPPRRQREPRPRHEGLPRAPVDGRPVRARRAAAEPAPGLRLDHRKGADRHGGRGGRAAARRLLKAARAGALLLADAAVPEAGLAGAAAGRRAVHGDAAAR